jgi:hypothetical protein
MDQRPLTLTLNQNNHINNRNVLTTHYVIACQT